MMEKTDKPEFRVVNFMSPDQAGRAAIGVALGLIILAAGWALLVRPVVRQAQKMETEIGQLENELLQKRRLIGESEEIHNKHQATGVRLNTVIVEKLVPTQASLGWVSLLLQDLASAEQMQILERTGSFESMRGSSGVTEPPAFQNFVAQFNLRGGYHRIGRFLARLEREVPYASMQSFSISRARESSPERQPQLNINIAYKFPRFNEQRFPLEERPVQVLELQ